MVQDYDVVPLSDFRLVRRYTRRHPQIKLRDGRVAMSNGAATNYLTSLLVFVVAMFVTAVLGVAVLTHPGPPLDGINGLTPQFFIEAAAIQFGGTIAAMLTFRLAVTFPDRYPQWLINRRWVIPVHSDVKIGYRDEVFRLNLLHPNVCPELAPRELVGRYEPPTPAEILVLARFPIRLAASAGMDYREARAVGTEIAQAEMVALMFAAAMAEWIQVMELRELRKLLWLKQLLD